MKEKKNSMQNMEKEPIGSYGANEHKVNIMCGINFSWMFKDVFGWFGFWVCRECAKHLCNANIE